MIAAEFNLDLGGFFSSLKKAEDSIAGLKFPPVAVGLNGLQDAAGAVANMQSAFQAANVAVSPLVAVLNRLEGVLHGMAGVARIANTAISILPQTFAGLNPAISKTFSGISLASRGFDVLRGKMTPLGGVVAYLELRNIGLSKSYAALASTLGVASSAVVGATRKVSQAAAGVGKGLLSGLAGVSMGFTSLLGPIAAVGGVAGVTAGGMALLNKSITSAADFETIKTGFVTLLGSMDAAESRIRELSKFAADTPFELPEVAKASRVLETLTRGALSTGKGLTLVGDVASGTNQPFEELAMWIGRLYDGLQSGRPVGEAMARLQELGVVSGETRGQIEKLQKSGQKGDQVWAIAEAALGRFAGNMKRQSGTWNGLLSNLSDNIGAVFREFGTPVMESLKPLLSSLVGFTAGLADDAAAFGQAVANAFMIVQKAFSTGQISELVSISLEIGFAKAVNFLLAAFRGLVAFLGSSLETLPERFIAQMKAIFDLRLWSGLGNILSSIGQAFISVIASGLAPIIDSLIGVLNKIPGVKIDFRGDDLAAGTKDLATAQFSQGAAQIAAALEAPTQALRDSSVQAFAAFKEAFDAAPGLMDEGGPGERLTALLSNLQSSIAADQTGNMQIAGASPGSPESSGFGMGKLVATSLASLGLGGLTSGDSTPQLNEAKRQTKELQGLRKDVQQLAAAQGEMRLVPIFGKGAFV